MSKKYYLNVYEVGRAYGGPEEGGWLTDHVTFLECHGEFVDSL